MGSKISVFIIVIAMVVLAGMVTDTSDKESEDIVRDDHKTYEETEDDKDIEKEFLFENYEIDGERFVGDVAKVDFSTNPLAMNFEDIIVRNVESAGVNFAGHYSIVTWSCGAQCQSSSIIDVITGEIVSYGIISEYGLLFSADSTLLVINPKENISEDDKERTANETDYYSLNDGELKFEGKEVGNEGVLENCIQAITNARNKITSEVVLFNNPCVVPFGWELMP